MTIPKRPLILSTLRGLRNSPSLWGGACPEFVGEPRLPPGAPSDASPTLAGPPPAHTPRSSAALPLAGLGSPASDHLCSDGARGSCRGAPRVLGWDARGNTDLDFVGALPQGLPCTARRPAHRREAGPRGRTWGSAFLLQNSARTWSLSPRLQ